MRMMNLAAIVAVLAVPSCSSTPPAEAENHQQAYEAELANGRVVMTILEMLDRGDIDKTRQVAMASLHVILSSLPELGREANPSPEQRNDELALARDALDYMLAHKEDWDPRLPSVKIGIRGLQRILTQPEDLRRFAELTNHLNAVEGRLSQTEGMQ